MKQKVIVKVCITDEKSRKKAMKTIVAHSGVVSACLQEKDKNQIEVIGEEIDSVVLTKLLRKCLGFAELISVNPIPAPEKKGEGDSSDKAKGNEKNIPVITTYPPIYYSPHYPYNGWGGYGYVELRQNDDPTCNIM